MDTTEEFTHIGLCAGYGGIELGLKRVLPTLRTVALCEIEAFAIANLVAKMEAGLLDPAPIWTDLKTFPWDSFRDRVDILTGGYPCQPFSAAGKRLGGEDSRHLWPFISAGIAFMRPGLCFFENVEGHISLGLPDVIENLGRLGYRATWGLFSAAEVGAPHQRKRVFIMAHRIDQGPQGWLRGRQDSRREGEHGHIGCGSAGVFDRWPSRPGEPQHTWEPPRVMADASGKQSKRGRNFGELESQTSKKQGEAQKWQWSRHSTGNQSANGMPNELGNTSDTRQPERRGRALGQPRAQQEFERPNCGHNNPECETQPAMGGDADGAASRMDHAKLCVTYDNRTDELRLLGNGVVPVTADLAFRTLLDDLQRQ